MAIAVAPYGPRWRREQHRTRSGPARRVGHSRVGTFTAVPFRSRPCRRMAVGRYASNRRHHSRARYTPSSCVGPDRPPKQLSAQRAAGRQSWQKTTAVHLAPAVPRNRLDPPGIPPQSPRRCTSKLSDPLRRRPAPRPFDSTRKIPRHRAGRHSKVPNGNSPCVRQAPVPASFARRSLIRTFPGPVLSLVSNALPSFLPNALTGAKSSPVSRQRRRIAPPPGRPLPSTPVQRGRLRRVWEQSRRA